MEVMSNKSTASTQVDCIPVGVDRDMSSAGGGGKVTEPVVEAYSVEETRTVTTTPTTTTVEAKPLTNSVEDTKR